LRDFGATYNYTSVGRDKNYDIFVDLYSFKCAFKQPYILEVERHKNNIFVIKFYQKNHRDSLHRYSLLNTKKVKKGKTGVENALVIMNTIVKVIVDTYSKNKKASFAFMGAPTLVELKGDKNLDGTVPFTKRYNIYAIYVKRHFDPVDFDHFEISSSSSYMIRSKANTYLTIDKVNDFYEYYIENYC